MSRDAVNFILDKYSVDSGVFKIFYDFENYVVDEAKTGDAITIVAPNLQAWVDDNATITPAEASGVMAYWAQDYIYTGIQDGRPGFSGASGAPGFDMRLYYDEDYYLGTWNIWNNWPGASITNPNKRNYNCCTGSYPWGPQLSCVTPSMDCWNWDTHTSPFSGWSGMYFTNTGAFADEATYVSSQPNADSLYSGRIYGDVDSFTGSSGSGNFNHGYIKVAHADNGLNSGYSGGATFLLSVQKSNVNPGVLFSNFTNGGNFSGYTAPTSGWELGLNAANKLYFRNYNELVPTIYTLNSVAAAQNIYGVRLDGGNVGMWHYDAATDDFNSTEFTVDENFIRPSYDWYIGTGEYQYEGYVDEFLYFSDIFGFGMLEEVSRAFFQDTTVSSAISGSLTGLVTGYEAIPTGETGNLYFTGVLSGTEGFTNSGVTPTGSALSGPVVAGDIYYELVSSTTGFLDNNYPFYVDTYSGFIASSAGTRITGFITGTSGFNVSGTRDVYVSSGVTGVISTGTGYTPLYGVTHYLATGEISGLVDVERVKYLPDTVYYIGQRTSSDNVLNGETGDFVEIITGISPVRSNVITPYGYNSLFERNTYLLESGSGVALFLNGLQQFEGTPLVTENEYYEKVFNVNSGDFFQSGSALFQNTFQSTSPSFNTDEVLCDLNQTGSKARLIITGSGQYNSAPFSEISADDTQVFFNGQKIYSGIDYESAGGLFRPTGTIVSTGLTGHFTTLPLQPGQASITGIGTYDQNFDHAQPWDTVIYYLNGVRQPPSQFIQHSTGVDLIQTGINIIDSVTGIVYNINGAIGMRYSSGDYWDG